MFEADLETEAENLETDPSSFKGAQKLAEKINAFWAARGIAANARLASRPFSANMRASYYVIVSDLVVGREVRAQANREADI